MLSYSDPLWFMSGMDQPPTPPTDRASAPSDAPESASAPTEQPADSAPGPAPSEDSPEQRRRAERHVEPSWDRDAYDALVAAGLRAPNMREFTLNSPEAWALFRPEATLLPQIHLLRHNPVERDEN